MSYKGTYRDFLKNEIIRLSKTEEPIKKSEFVRIKNIQSKRTNNEKKSKII